MSDDVSGRRGLLGTAVLFGAIALFIGMDLISDSGEGAGAVHLALELTVLMVAAFGTRIVESGLRATPRGQREAAASLGMTGPQAFRHVTLLPALARVWPAPGPDHSILDQACLAQISPPATQPDSFIAAPFSAILPI